ncbi:MAG: hypothetical protein FWE29_03975 [Defluviitaleaceae bacterium]|nr:hypothetical protein [Defluviitaleaceae bacterium]
MKITKAIFIKQFRSLIKNPIMIIQAVFYLALIIIITFLANDNRGNEDCISCIPAYVCEQCLIDNAPPDTPTPSLAGLFAVMFVGLSLVGFSSSLVYEDKTTQNLRFMSMAGVKPKQYLIGTALSLLIISFLILILFAIVGWYVDSRILWFLSVGTFGIIVSILLGITIGMSKYPVLATPLSMVLGLGPMLSSFNENLAHMLRFTYTQQINIVFSDIREGLTTDLTNNFLIIAANGLVVLLLFIWVNRKGSLTS